MRTLGRIILGLFASIGFIVVLLIALGIYAASHLAYKHEVSAPDRFVLTVDLDKGLAENPDEDGLTTLNFGTHPSFEQAAPALKRAKDDPRVVAVAATINDRRLGVARVQELRDLITQIRSAGKPTLEFSETIGEGEAAMSSYYLASAFSDVWVQPSGSVGIAGISIEEPFIKKLLDRLGLKATFIKRKEFKSAAESLTDDSMSQPNREELQALLGSWFDQMVNGIAADRKLTPDAVKALVDRGPLTAIEAKDAGLIDHLGYRDEFEAALHKVAGSLVHVPLARYVDMAPPSDRPEPKKTIALITGVGEISRGGESESPLETDDGIRSRVMAKAIRDAAADSTAAAILIRIDSPGGSYVASDTIWREVVLARQKKPVIVSMGDVAASGGYFIAMAANHIFADPGTITGSIGVLGGKISIAGLSDKLGIQWDDVSFGQSAGLDSIAHDFTPQQLTRLNQVMDVVYNDFTSKAAQGRNMAVTKLEKVARGRVWSGKDALDQGLVDELGGFAQALDYTKTQIGLKPTDMVYLVSFPRHEEPLTKLLKALTDGEVPSYILSTVRIMATVGQDIAPLWHGVAGVQTHGPQLYMPPVVAD